MTLLNSHASEFCSEPDPKAQLKIKLPLGVLPPLGTAWGGFFICKLGIIKVSGGIWVLSASLAALPEVLWLARENQLR